MPGPAPDVPASVGAAGVDVLLLRLSAPLMSFGGIAVDERRPTLELPGRALVTGLVANALGWYHGEAERLARLQERLIYAARQDLPGESLEDFHTVDLSQDFLRQGWTTWGRPEQRGKGAATQGTHIRYRHYVADAAVTVALTLEPAAEAPTLDDVERAFRRPARPLFLGRKTCLPSRPLLGARGETDRLRASSVLHALTEIPSWTPRISRRLGDETEPLRVWWPAALGGAAPEAASLPSGVRHHRTLALVDERDWHHQFHAGRRFVHEGILELAQVAGGAHG